MMDPADAFLAHVNQLADNAGIQLDDDDLREIFEESHRRGFNSAATESAFDDHFDWGDDDDDDFEEDEADVETGDERLIRHVNDDLERLSAERGRPLTGHEVEIIARGAVTQADRFDQINGGEALGDYYGANPGETRPDTDTSAGRQEFYRQRLADKDQPAELDPGRELDLDNTADRHAYFEARLNGAEFEDAGGEAA